MVSVYTNYHITQTTTQAFISDYADYQILNAISDYAIQPVFPYSYFLLVIYLSIDLMMTKRSLFVFYRGPIFTGISFKMFREFLTLQSAF